MNKSKLLIVIFAIASLSLGSAQAWSINDFFDQKARCEYENDDGERVETDNTKTKTECDEYKNSMWIPK